MLSRDSDIHAAKELKTLHSDSNQSSAKPDVLKSSVSMVASLNAGTPRKKTRLLAYIMDNMSMVSDISQSVVWLTSLVDG